MESKPKILFVCPFSNTDAKTFVETLAQAIDWDIKLSDSGLSALFLQLRKFDIVHFFLPATGKSHLGISGKGSNSFQTIFNLPQDSKAYRKSIFADRVVVFSQQESDAIRQQIPGTSVDVILPCVRSRPFANLEPANRIREKYDVMDRLLVVALNDFSDQQHFTAFLYTVREYNRRGGFRFVVPLYRQDKRSMLWRNRLAEAIQKEKLHSTILLDAPADIPSLMNAADFTLFMDKRPERPFGFPMITAEALCTGKPVLCYNVPPVNEIVSAFRKDWIASVNEDFSRISRDLLKESPHLEQISTELARFARSKMSAEAVGENYKQLYNSRLSL
ncbi:glycosyltransferase [bacterium]|nr:glycosyltransferase [bacterium]MCI0602567.1 glycosyltransferase [bacterium]